MTRTPRLSPSLVEHGVNLFVLQAQALTKSALRRARNKGGEKHFNISSFSDNCISIKYTLKQAEKREK